MDNRNLILAFTLSFAVLFIWDMMFMGPERERLQQARSVVKEPAGGPAGLHDGADPALGGVTGGLVANGPGAANSGAGASGALAAGPVDRAAALAASPARIRIQTPLLEGSINLAGARLDDLSLQAYNETVAPDSPPVVMLTPGQTAQAHYIQNGIIAGNDAGETALWQAETTAPLTVGSPVVLTRSAGDLSFEMTIGIDENYMFSVTQKVTNSGAEAVNVAAYGITLQRDVPADVSNFFILHEGPLSIVDGHFEKRKFANVVKKGGYSAAGESGWIGITTKLWLSAMIPPRGRSFQATVANIGIEDAPLFRASYQLTPESLAPGDQYEVQSHFYAGAKQVDLLKQYQQPVASGGLGIPSFDKAVDWGWFSFLTRPIFLLLQFFAGFTGNYGVAILLLTLAIKIPLIPLANKSYASMAAMKKLQPEMERLKKQYTDDRMGLQQSVMALYKKEKVNPMAGCWPVLVQMPIFFALYKTLFVTIETRHQPFLYIRDLSAQDPTNIFNLFGLLPFDPTAIPLIGVALGIGILPILMGVFMWVQTKLNPPAGDPVQQKIFALMPLIFVFVFAPFAAGLVLYWVWNTILGVAQQYFIMKRHGADVALFDNIRQSFRGKNAE